MWSYPEIDPVIFHIYGPFGIRWYGLMYVVAFIIGYFILKKRAKEGAIHMNTIQIQNFLFWIIIGVLLGGRLGYVFFYNLSYHLQNPMKIFAVWEGGMSFHGGLLGVLMITWWYVTRYKLSWLQLSDVVVLGGSLGLFFGRVGNFINGELYGRVTESSIGLVFPQGGPMPRHPSQLYEAVFEGLFGFILFWTLRNRLRRGQLTFIGFLYYGAVRFVIEFFREPDVHIGYFIGWMTLGQILCIAMLLFGAFGLWWVTKIHPSPKVLDQK